MEKSFSESVLRRETVKEKEEVINSFVDELIRNDTSVD